MMSRLTKALPGPAPPIDSILVRLLLGRATDLQAVRELGWFTGRAPSGAVFELHCWPLRGYAVVRRLKPSQHTQRLGVFSTWEEAVDRALQA
jgi:hypothetical protein